MTFIPLVLAILVTNLHDLAKTPNAKASLLTGQITATVAQAITTFVPDLNAYAKEVCLMDSSGAFSVRFPPESPSWSIAAGDMIKLTIDRPMRMPEILRDHVQLLSHVSPLRPCPHPPKTSFMENTTIG